LAGQDADSFLEKHASGGEGDEGLEQGRISLSRSHPLRGHGILVVPFPDRRETFLLCPPNPVITYITLPDLATWPKQG
jgi:hypothetical protein